MYRFFFLVLVSFLLFSPVSAQDQWAILTYMEPREDLHDMALFNLSRAALSGPCEHARFYALIHTHKDVAWLYKIEDHALVLCKQFRLVEPVTNTILEAWHYILNEGRAKHYGMSFWGHGYGVLKPHYDVDTESWAVHADGENVGSCSLKGLEGKNNHHGHKGILPNSVTHESIDNAQMIQFFDRLVQNEFLGQKVAFCGMDCCKGAMIEHSYQLAAYVDYLVASQECELADGWDYYALLQSLKKESRITPENLVRAIVQGYQEYYQGVSQAQTYTLSAWRTSGSIAIAYLIRELIVVCKELPVEEQKTIGSWLTNARERCVGFCDAPTYVDIYNLCEEICHEVQAYKGQHKKIDILIEKVVRDISSCVKRALVQKTGGSKVDHAHGASIYFPRYHIDESYISTKFAQETDWLAVLKAQLKRAV